ncbi:MAG: signal peptidase II [Victivallaceae bacterium]|nr:signal peptidase II [Victivallaceae bacterium]MDD3117031.1 signal peptidase II [Victivallaceae bacterium]MDD3702980.1 signal peptidase II [Victivallaceae bacterium]MDD4317257.1 signal peptidase II [Victivallaceae bacterium]MDD5663017.1 signal peptidase II [Victivallaceae bacterium]
MWVKNPENFNHNPKERTIIFFAAIVAAVILIIDQVTKILITHYFMLYEQKSIIPGFFNLTYIINRGAAWGILQGQTLVLLCIGIAVAISSIVFMRWLTEGFTERYWAVLVVLSGIIGNSIDRIWRGEVVDFLDFFIDKWHWPAFNVADMAICIGLTVYFLSLLLRPNPKKNTSSQSQD